ncbi:MAG: DUF3052 family protein [Rhodothermaceae bacterium]|nr:DUF3052 family protein [Rhodothermaceae bacterium]
MSTGYSGTPLWKKLGYKPDFCAVLVNPPEEYAALTHPLPEGVVFADTAVGANLVHLFATEADALADALLRYRDQIARDGMVWVSWPKRASKVPTDVTEDTIRAIALPLGLVDVKVCAVDATWSGLKLVIRRELR